MEESRLMIEAGMAKRAVLFNCFLVSIICFLSSVFGAFPAHADKIYLKDGKSYEGKLIGKSDRRYLFSMDVGGEKFQMSFFPEDIERLELDEKTVETQIPYLKDVESFKVQVKRDKSSSYELSLYKDSQIQDTDKLKFSKDELKSALSKQEAEYYNKFNSILNKYTDRFQKVQNIYLNLTSATKEDFAQAKDYMDQLYFELNGLYVPEIFKKSHLAYLESVKASFLSFNALQQGMLDEASKQTKISDETKQRSMSEFRQAIMSRKSAAQKLQK